MNRILIRVVIVSLSVCAFIILGYIFYPVFWFNWYKWQMMSGNDLKRGQAVIAIASKNKEAMPYIKDWLRSDNSEDIQLAFNVIKAMKSSAWKDALPELFDLLKGQTSDLTMRTVGLLFSRDEIGTLISSRYKSAIAIRYNHPELEDIKIRKNIAFYILKYRNYLEWPFAAVNILAACDDEKTNDLLIRILRNASGPDLGKHIMPCSS